MKHRPCSSQQISRRRFLSLAATGVAGLSAWSWMAPLAARAGQLRNKPKACILLWMSGGPSHVDTFDPKPDAPDGHRGPLGTIPTSVPGIHVCELLPRFAKQMKHAAIIRSMTTPEVDHFLACYHMHTGYRQRAGGLPYPAMGSIVWNQNGDANEALPGYVLMNDGSPSPGTSAGYLGQSYQPLRVQSSGSVPHVDSPVPDEAFAQRVELLRQLNDDFYGSHLTQLARDHDTVTEQAVRLMGSDKLDAFDLSGEPASLREAYGGAKFGDPCLRARRLVEAGVPFVEVYLSDWDAHAGIDWHLKAHLPPVDAAVAALVTDLESRGLLDSTLIIWMGEFGRTPHINKNAGRDHHSKAWSTVLMGGGVKGGQVIGATDKIGEEVTDRPVTAIDYLSTIYLLLGIDPDDELPSPGGRPVPIVNNQVELSRPVREIIG